jgi:hypothetical protein
LTFSSIQKYLKRECTAVKEERVNSWHLLEAPKRYQTIANHWKSSLMKINDGSSASEPEDQQVAISFLTDLGDKITKASGDPQEWEDLIAATMGRAQELRVQLDGASSACKGASKTYGFTFLRKYPILKAIYKELELQKLIGSELSRKRPDGLVVNWKKRHFFALEFTRAYDMNSEDLERADVFKTRKYAEMCDRISRTLGPPWAGTVITFTAGV